MLSMFFSHFAFAQMCLCILILLKHCRDNQAIKLFILLMLSGCGYLLGDLAGGYLQPKQTSHWLSWLGFFAGNALPGVFWLVSLSVFGDKNNLKPWQYYLASSTLVLPLAVKLFEFIFQFSLSQQGLVSILYHYGQLALELSLISHALYVAVQNWRDDLIQERRYIRGGVITTSAIYIMLVIVFEQLLTIEWSWVSTAKALLLAVLTITINFFLFDSKLSVLFVTNQPIKEPEKSKFQSKELAKLLAAMESEQLYQQEGLTIASFAKHLAIHEYKLRNLINGELNYRNFNDFLNFYRIKEVTEKLAHPDFYQLPILTLALDSGFRSLSSFNKAFKNTHGITPTEYKKKLSSC